MFFPFAFLFGVALCAADVQVESTSASTAVYVGTYTQGADRGIFHFLLDGDTGSLTPRGVTTIANPSFLAPHPSGRFLYSVFSERSEAGPRTDGVAAFAIDADTGRLTLLGAQTMPVLGACHVSLRPDGGAAFVASYTDGAVASLHVEADGRLSPVVSLVQPFPAADRPAPQLHAAVTDLTGRFVLVTDLAGDRLLVYDLDDAAATLGPRPRASLDAAPGSGPRHLALHPGGRHVYVLHMSDSTVTTMNWDASRGALSPTQTLSTLPADFTGRNVTAEVVVHPTGRFLYASNRGHDSVAMFRVDPDAGLLTPIGWVPTRGSSPRHINVDPTGRWLIACNQHGDSVQVFRIDGHDGSLAPAGEPVPVPAPACVVFVPAP